jgi:hypothetical protein
LRAVAEGRCEEWYNLLVVVLVQWNPNDPANELGLNLRMMTPSRLRLITKFARVLVALTVVGVTLTPVPAQDRDTKPVQLESDKRRDDDTNGPLTEMEEELRAKRAIKSADKEHQENLDRARDLSNLGTAIVSSFKQKHSLEPEDIKKLEKVEKLAKGIRHAAGGSEDDTKMAKPPTDMASAVEMLGDLSRSLKAKVEKTPKHVISAAVIDEANVLLELVRIVRTLPSKG